MANWKLVNREDGRTVAEDLEIADRMVSRIRGLMFRKGLDSGKALLIVPCSSVHTHWMRFPIDVVMLDAEGTVVGVEEDVAPWRFVRSPKKTHAVVEFSAKTARVSPGDRFRIEEVDQTLPALSESLRFLAA